MQVRPLESSDVDVVAGWMADPENYKWLDFGAGQQVLSAASIALMRQRDLHDLRVFGAADDPRAAGIVALSNICRRFRSATLWYVLGDKSQAGRGLTSRAVSCMVTAGFREHGLESIHAWAVVGNLASIRVLEKNGFRLIGRQRRCHVVDGQPRDRLLFDILATEHVPYGS
jgi:RimJ/RimL family protein N-acetyltransferase